MSDNSDLSAEVEAVREALLARCDDPTAVASEVAVAALADQLRAGKQALKRGEPAEWGEIGDRIRALRELSGVKQKELAGALGIDTSAMSRIESGNRRLDTRELVFLATFLGVSPLVVIEGPMPDKAFPEVAQLGDENFRLRERITALEAENEYLNEQIEMFERVVTPRTERAERAEAENAKLREAADLAQKVAAKMREIDRYIETSNAPSLWTVQRLAREALASTEREASE